MLECTDLPPHAHGLQQEFELPIFDLTTLATMIYITDFSQKDGMNEAWLSWLPAEHLPTRATIGVADLGEGVLIEIVVTAAR